jgi:hypothetical protein
LLTHVDNLVTVIDVKPKQFLTEPKVQAQLTWTGQLCAAKGWAYEVFSGGDAVTLRNVRTLALDRRPERLPAGLLASARASLTEDVTTLGDLLARKPVKCDNTTWRAAVMALAPREHGLVRFRSEDGSALASRPRRSRMLAELEQIICE